MMETLRGKTALVTGASSGLGADFARQLAAAGCGLVLVARRVERLLALQAEITARHPVAVECVALDLTEPAAPQRLYDQLRQSGRTVDVLINNAGLGFFGEFLAVPWAKAQQTLALDIVALTHLTHLFGADMVQRKSGYILLVASTAAFQPAPTYAVYSAAKSYVLSFGEALHYELRPTGVSCTVLCPGVTRTEFHAAAGQRYGRYHRMTMMESGEVVRLGLAAMLRRQSSVVPGWLNALVAGLARLLPRQVLARMAAQAMQEP